MSPGDIVINAVIRAAAIDSAEIIGDASIFVWAANAAEQIEAALADAGYRLVPISSKRRNSSGGE
jgi:EamA domain-containing membrane protein RarD